MDDISELVRTAANAEEVWEERRFRVYVDGGPSLIVVVSDQGPGANPNLRYSASAQFADSASSPARGGNPDSTIHGALSNVHWSEFS